MKPWIAVLALAASGGQAAAFSFPDVMPVYAVKAERAGVTVRIPPWGCTPQRSELTVAVTKSSGRPLLLIARRHPGEERACRAPQAADITWSYEELDLEPGEPFVLANPLAAPDEGAPR